jgi:hypothetical protein
MSITFLTHLGCGGNIVLDASRTTKLIAPSFAVGCGGIYNLTLDIHVVDKIIAEPAFLCISCNVEIAKDAISSQVCARCQICGGVFTVDKMSVHSEISCLCFSCRSKLDKYAQEGGECEETIKDYSEQFGITRKLKTVTLEKVLTSPITI